MADADQSQAEQVRESGSAQVNHPGEYLVVAVMFIIVSVLFVGSLMLPGIFQGHANDSGTLPQIAIFIVLILLSIEFIKLLRKKGKLGKLSEARAYLFSKEVLILIGAVVCYALLLEILHFEVTTILFLWCCMYLMDRRRPLHKLIVTACTVGGLVLVFSTVFNVMLP